MAALDTDFFHRVTATVAEELLGCVLVHDDGQRRAGRIVETEAYLGTDDPASHASDGPSGRNEVMFGPPGRSYVYICYGIHHMFNITTEDEGTPGAVLVRALEPLDGIDRMQEERGVDDTAALCDGPGKLCEALGIDKRHNDIAVTEGHLRIEPGETPATIATSGRIGVSGGEDMQLRFYEEGNPHVSQ
ncbi:MAG: DNA-3-methyladenine glycosylase [Candidatus Nanohaloarchaea archaeon]|nr:DNA-3-methyladenine glycosylase [Candidatus Nanohaloarchaea archaeon]